MEAEVIAPVVKFARRAGVLYERNHKGPGAEAGWPDHTFYIPFGRAFKIEFKRPGEPAKKLQVFRINELRRLGYDVEIHDNSDEACAAIASRMAAVRRSGGCQGLPRIDRFGRVVG